MIYHTEYQPIKRGLKRALRAAEKRGDQKEADRILLKVKWQLRKQSLKADIPVEVER